MAAVVPAGVDQLQSVRAKLALVEGEHATRGTRIVFSTAELNAWIMDSAKTHVPQGLRNPRLLPGIGMATGSAEIDFVRLRQAATGEAPGWLVKNLFAGERPVKATVRFQSRNGQARVDVESVEISGIPLEGKVLDFAFDAFVRPAFPYASISQWFTLQYGIDHFTVNPSGVAVFLRR